MFLTALLIKCCLNAFQQCCLLPCVGLRMFNHLFSSYCMFLFLEGRIKDVQVPRPKLVRRNATHSSCSFNDAMTTNHLNNPCFRVQATLNSVEAVKKWIPRIKKEIEYYLQVTLLIRHTSNIVKKETGPPIHISMLVCPIRLHLLQLIRFKHFSIFS